MDSILQEISQFFNVRATCEFRDLSRVPFLHLLPKYGFVRKHKDVLSELKINNAALYYWYEGKYYKNECKELWLSNRHFWKIYAWTDKQIILKDNTNELFINSLFNFKLTEMSDEEKDSIPDIIETLKWKNRIILENK